MTNRLTPEQIARNRDAPGVYTRQQFLHELVGHGYVIVHPDDVPPMSIDDPRNMGWNDCRRHIFGDTK